SPGSERALGHGEQVAHLGAIGLVAIGIAMIMTPAALHRHSRARQVTATFIRLPTRLLLWSMLPLAVSICVEFYLVGRVIVPRPAAAVLAAALMTVFVLLWVVLPRAQRLQKLVEGRG